MQQFREVSRTRTIYSTETHTSVLNQPSEPVLHHSVWFYYGSCLNKFEWCVWNVLSSRSVYYVIVNLNASDITWMSFYMLFLN